MTCVQQSVPIVEALQVGSRCCVDGLIKFGLLTFPLSLVIPLAPHSSLNL